MAFTNVWDDTFPPDTQLANQLGLDLRNLRTDVQQRMAAISGLDASKPAFGSDNTPANWNGILFFATDTGKIYQFNNPSWTDITTLILAGGVGTHKIYQNPVTVSHTGTLTGDTIYTIPIPTWAANNTIRIRMGITIQAQGVGTTGVVIGPPFFPLMVFGSGNSGHNQVVDMLICNGSPSGAGTVLLTVASNNTDTGVTITGFSGTAGITSLDVVVQNANVGDRQVFGPILAEIIP